MAQPTDEMLREKSEPGRDYQIPAVLAKEPLDPWLHRAENMRCRTCMFYVPKVNYPATNPEKGRCRRHAPTMNGYPVVFPHDWCGDHKLA